MHFANKICKRLSCDMTLQGKTRSIAFRDLGLIDYKEAWDLQEDRLAQVIKETGSIFL